MSNNNAYWGRRFGSWSNSIPKGHKEPRGLVFNVRSYGSPQSNSGKNMKSKGSGQSIHDKADYQERLASVGRPIIRVDYRNKRIAA